MYSVLSHRYVHKVCSVHCIIGSSCIDVYWKTMAARSEGYTKGDRFTEDGMVVVGEGGGRVSLEV